MDTPALRWLAEVLGSDVTPVRSLSFGITSELDLVETRHERFVLRRYTDLERVAAEPQLIADEVSALVAARQVLGDLVPRPIASDDSGAAAGHPALVMTYLRGAARIHDLNPVLLVEPLTRLHAAVPPSDLPAFRHWFRPAEVRPPAWSAAPDEWKRLIALACEPQPSSPDSFLHRDFHPGNLLWEAGALSGIVDWPLACRGPRGADLAHTRWNLALVDGCPAAERFLLEYVRANPGYRHDPWWDAAELLTHEDGFAGVMAFNAFGAGLDVGLLRARAEDFARLVCEQASSEA